MQHTSRTPSTSNFTSIIHLQLYVWKMGKWFEHNTSWRFHSIWERVRICVCVATSSTELQ